MNKEFLELTDFVLGLLAYIRPDMTIELFTPFMNLKLDSIDFTLISIECEEKYQIIVDEEILGNCMIVNDALVYLFDLLKLKKKTYYDIVKK